MEHPLKPIVDFLHYIGINPALFVAILLLLVIYKTKHQYMNWSEKRQKRKTGVIIDGLWFLIMFYAYLKSTFFSFINYHLQRIRVAE